MSADDEYNRITQSFLSDMARVDASVEDYRAGLRAAIEEIQTEISASEQCEATG